MVTSVSALPHESGKQLLFYDAFSSYVKHRNQSHLWGNGAYFGLHFHVIVQQGKAGQGLKTGRNLEAGTELETVEQGCLLACSSWITNIIFLTAPVLLPSSILPNMASLIRNLKMLPQTCLQANLI